MAVAGCNGVKETAEQPLEWDQELVFTATREDIDPDTKAVRMDGGETWWSPEEEISLFYGAGTAGGSKFISQNETVAKTATFSGNLQVSGSDKDYWAVYPYSESNECDGESITTTVPDVQYGVKGNFSGNVFPAIARSKSKSLSFRNICGGLKFSVARSDIKSITFESNNGEVLAGKVKISYEEPVSYGYIDGKSSVTIMAPDGGTFATGKYYYISMLPASLSGGFTMTFVTEDQKGTLYSNRSQTIKRSTFGVLSYIDAAVNYWQDVPKPIQSISVIPDSYYEGAPLVGIWEFIGPKLNSGYPYLTQLTSPNSGSFICSSPCKVSYSIEPQNVNIADYDWFFVNRIAPNGSEKTDLVSIVGGPVKNGNRYDFPISINKALDENKVEDQIALRAVSQVTNNTGQYDYCTSDYAYIAAQNVFSYSIIDKEKYNATPAVIQRFKTEYIGISDTYDIMMPYDGIIDIADYIDTFAEQAGRTVAELGITPQYELWFAGMKDSNVCISKNSKEAPYVTDYISNTNQNVFIRFDGSKVRVDETFLSTLAPAIGRTPLIYVRATYNGRPLADCFIKLYIVKEAGPEPEPLGWDIFIKHDVVFKYDNLSASYTQTGTSGTMTAPRKSYIDYSDKDLLVDWEEINRFVLDDGDVAMSYEEFASKYDTNNLQLILTAKGTVPGSSLPDRSSSMLADLSNISIYYGSGFSFTTQSSSNWNSALSSLSISINYAIKSGKYYVYVLIPAKDNTVNIDVVLAFSITVQPHQHSWAIYNWILSPDYVLNDNPYKPWKLYDPKPANVNAAADRTKYGVVCASDKQNAYSSGLIWHFKEFGRNNNITVNYDADYVFSIMNYKKDDVFFSVTNAGVVADSLSGVKHFSTVKLTAAELNSIIGLPKVGGAYNPTKATPFIRLADGATTGETKDVLIKVTEICRTDNSKRDAYYYYEFYSVKPEIRLKSNLALGDYKVCSDYLLDHEMIDGVYAEGEKIIEWDATIPGWKAVGNAADYGITQANISGLNFKFKTFEYDQGNNEGEFYGYLYKVNASEAPALGYTVASFSEPGIEWFNSGPDLMHDLKVSVVIEGGFTYGYEFKFNDGKGACTILSSANAAAKKNRNHQADGTVSDPIWKNN